MDDWEHDEAVCPRCGHEPTLRCDCPNYACDDGLVDMHEFDDPMLFDEGDVEECQECHGYGVLRWCPECGYDLNLDPERLLGAQEPAL